MAAALAAIDQEPAGRNEITFRTEAPLDDIPRGVHNGNAHGNGGNGGNGNGTRLWRRRPHADGGEFERALADALAEAIGRLGPGSSLAIKGPGGEYRIEIEQSPDPAIPS
jgi:hypothetical protein